MSKKPASSAAPTSNNPMSISHELHAVAATIAGLEEVLRAVSDGTKDEFRNALALMAKIAADANLKICVCADQVYHMKPAQSGKGGAA